MVLLLLAALLVAAPVVAVVAHASRPRSFHGPTDVRVPVDDFVVGDLPMVCVRTGAPADGLVVHEGGDRGFQAWWLPAVLFGFLLLGPVGVVVIVVAWVLSPRQATVGGSLPMTRAALAEQNRLVSLGRWVWGVPFVAFLGGTLLLLVPGPAALPVNAIAVGLLVFGLIGGFVALGLIGGARRRASVQVHLDGTRRWVELRGVHAAFAAAADRQTRARHRAARERAEGSTSAGPGFGR